MTPPITRSVGRYSASPADANVAVMPSSVNTDPNPRTYAKAWVRARQRLGVAPGSCPATATAVSCPR